MAHASVTYTWADGNSVTCEVEAVSEHPDILDELVTRAFRLYAKVSEFADDDAEETP